MTVIAASALDGAQSLSCPLWGRWAECSVLAIGLSVRCRTPSAAAPVSWVFAGQRRIQCAKEVTSSMASLSTTAIAADSPCFITQTSDTMVVRGK